MDVEITKANGSSYRLSDHDVVIRDFVVSSIEMMPSYSEVDGRHGYIDMGATYGSRTIRIPFYIDAHDLSDVALLRDKLFELVTDVEPFYIREMRRPKYAPMHVCDDGESDDYEDKYVGGKRYKVRLTSTVFEIEQMFTYGFGELMFETTDLPFAESIGTTADIDSNGVNADDELWGFGMGLTSDYREDDDPLKYTIHAKEGEYFRIFNAGNVVIHPFQMDLKITIKDVVGSDGRVQLRNQTNYDYLRINDDDITENDAYVFDGAVVTKNGTAFLRNTERTFISLNRKWNRFQLYYCESATIEFDFRFYYL